MKKPNWKNVTIIFNPPTPEYREARIQRGLVRFTDGGEEYVFDHTHFRRREGRTVLISKNGDLKIGRFTYALPARRLQAIPQAV